ncbi:MAG: MFS transporter [Candidatus Aminicenantes bacterium]|nr:MAG: MFS transporter [Candidatus Aminicenantes bacterium]
MSTLRRWLIMTCLCLSGGIIYLLPYLREVYYIPLQEALRLSNTQLGVLMSVFGVAAMVCYFPGGWIADKVSPRKLITISMISTGIMGLYFSSFPSYKMSIVVHGFWGISVTLTFWAALIKATRNWAPPTQQGRAFGILESGRGIAEVVCSTALLALFAKLGSSSLGLSWVIILFSIIDIIIGVMAWFVLTDSPRNSLDRKEEKEKIGPQEIVKVLKMPVIWLISIVILAAYSAYWGSYYFTPYATDVFMMSVVFGGALGVGKMWVKPLSALGAGFLADRIGASKTVVWSFAVLIASFSIFILTPGGPGFVVILVANTAIASLAIFALRGIYFALLEEGSVPLALTGTATGIVSVIGYTPDIFMPLTGGALLDDYPGALGYRYFFMFIAGLCLLGLMAAIILLRKFVRKEGGKYDKRR